MTDESDLFLLEDETAGVVRRVLADHAEHIVPGDRFSDVLDRAYHLDAGNRSPGRFKWLLAAAGVALVVGLLMPIVWPSLSLLGRVTPQVGANPSMSVTTPVAPPSLPTLQRDLPIYYVGADHRLYREFRDLPTQDDRLATAVGAVLNVAPADPSYTSLWAGGQVNSATVVGTRIVLDISQSAFATFTSRPIAEAAINQVVYTAIGAVGDQGGARSVQILMDGSPNLPVLGAPATDFVQTGTTPLGLIWILTPDSATPLPSGELTLRGYQQVALEDPVVTWAVLDDQNQVVREGSVEARGNEVGWRSWEVKLTLTAGEYVFRVSSAEATAQERHFTVQ